MIIFIVYVSGYVVLRHLGHRWPVFGEPRAAPFRTVIHRLLYFLLCVIPDVAVRPHLSWWPGRWAVSVYRRWNDSVVGSAGLERTRPPIALTRLWSGRQAPPSSLPGGVGRETVGIPEGTAITLYILTSHPSRQWCPHNCSLRRNPHGIPWGDFRGHWIIYAHHGNHHGNHHGICTERFPWYYMYHGNMHGKVLCRYLR